MLVDAAELIQRAKRDQPAAFAEIYERYHTSVYRYIFYRSGTAELAEKLVSDVFVQLVNDIDQLALQETSLSIGLYAIADSLLSALPRIPSTAPDDHTAPPGRPQQLTPEHIVQAIDSLSQEQRQVVTLKFIEGVDDEALAQLLGSSTSAVHGLLQQSLISLAITLAELDANQAPSSPEQQQAQLERVLGEGIENLAHELRTPLNLIQGYAELLIRSTLGPIEPEQQEALKVIYDRARYLGQLVHNLTTLRAIPREALILDVLSVPEWVKGAVEEVRQKAAQTGIHLKVTISDDLPSIPGDMEHLSVALSQILDNAIKFSPKGGVVSVKAWAERDHVYVSVQDEGIGIASDHLDRIFEHFYQADGSTTRRFGGVGLGLTVAQAVVRAHEGNLWARSEGEGQGATFILALPMKPSSGSPLGQMPPRLDPTLSQALDECLPSLEIGRAAVDECIDRFPGLAADLRPLLMTALRIRRTPRPAPSHAAFVAGKARMLEALAAKKRREERALSLPERAWESMRSAFDRLSIPDVPKLTPALRPALATAFILVMVVFGMLFTEAWLSGTVRRQALLSNVEGLVEVLSDGSEDWRPVTTSEQLNAGDRIRTGGSSLATLVIFDGSQTYLEENTEVSIAQMNSRRGGSGKTIVLHQWSGQTSHRVAPLIDTLSRFQVETATAVAAVRGTEFMIVVDNEGATHVRVLSGIVRVTAEEVTVEVANGEETIALPQRPPLAVRPIDTALPTPSGELTQVTREAPSVAPTTEPTPSRSPEAAQPASSKPKDTATPESILETTPTPGAPSQPTKAPRVERSPTPTPMPTSTPTPRPTPTQQRPVPTPQPTDTPTPRPTLTLTPEPTATSTPRPTLTSTIEPTIAPSSTPTETLSSPTPTILFTSNLSPTPTSSLQGSDRTATPTLVPPIFTPSPAREP